MFFFSSEQFERIEVEDVLDGLASPLLLFAQIRTNYPPFFSVDKADKKQKKKLCFLITWACPLPLGRGSNKA